MRNLNFMYATPLLPKALGSYDEQNSNSDINFIMQHLDQTSPRDHEQTIDYTQASINTLNLMQRAKVRFLPKIFEENEAQDDHIIDEADRNEQVLKSTWSAAFNASFRYSMSQLKREKQASIIGCSTIFLIVFITAFICVFQNNSASLFYMMAIGNSGDTDLLVTSNQKIDAGNDNQGLYKDDNRHGFYQETPFNMPADALTTVSAKGQQKTKVKSQTLTFPAVNCTEIEDMLNESWNVNGKDQRIKETIGIKGVFPRWLGFANLTRDMGLNKDI